MLTDLTLCLRAHLAVDILKICLKLIHEELQNTPSMILYRTILHTKYTHNLSVKVSQNVHMHKTTGILLSF